MRVQSMLGFEDDRSAGEVFWRPRARGGGISNVGFGWRGRGGYVGGCFGGGRSPLSSRLGKPVNSLQSTVHISSNYRVLYLCLDPAASPILFRPSSRHTCSFIPAATSSHRHTVKRDVYNVNIPLPRISYLVSREHRMILERSL